MALRDIPVAWQAGLATPSISAATVFILEATNGTIVRLTEAPEPFDVDGNTYYPMPGIGRSAIPQRVGIQTLALDLDITTEAGGLIEPDDVRDGVWRDAGVTIAYASPENPDWGLVPLVTGEVANIRRTNRNFVTFEVAGPLSQAKRVLVEYRSATCRTFFGTQRCGMPVLPDDVERSTAYAVGQYVRARIGSAGTPADYQGVLFRCTTAGTTAASAPAYSASGATTDGTAVFTAEAAQFLLYGQIASAAGNNLSLSNLSGTLPANWADRGLVVFRSGRLGGGSPRAYDVKESGGTSLKTFLKVKPAPAVGDWVEITRGCALTFEACVAFNNPDNFRGEPRVPGASAVNVSYREFGVA